MNWEKKGLIYTPNKQIWWRNHYGILPTPIHLPELNIIRVYFATTCKDKYGRVTFIDLDEVNPSMVVSDPQIISLDVGDVGAFDDCGVNPSAVLKVDKEWFMYFAGYQRHLRTPYSIFSGLAKSDDGNTFKRISRVPMLERTETELSLRSAPTVIFDKGIFKMVYVSDFGWLTINSPHFDNRLMPTYCLRYGESFDGVDWQCRNVAILSPSNDEFGFGRPYLVKEEGYFKLYYSIRSTSKGYRLGYATSIDCITWTRKDEEIGIDVSLEGWDSQMICYPAVIDVKFKKYLFYNGNNNGETGFGYAELITE